MAAAGSSASARRYGYLDGAAPTGTSYYCLRQVDQDGTAAYSPVRAVTLGAGGLALYPYPWRGYPQRGHAGRGCAGTRGFGPMATTSTVGDDGTVAPGGLARAST